jgi:23S rRNA pseudouridine1911/1915/1917 synthase
MKTVIFCVEESLVGERLDVAVARHIDDLTRARVQKLIDEGQVRVDGINKKANYRLRATEKVNVSIPDARPTAVEAEDIKLQILYEDKDLLVLNKPKGLVVHPAAGHADGTLVNALLYHCDDLSGIGGEARPGIVHRLDKDTSGVLVVAKNDRAHQSLSQQFKEHTVTREYVAVVHGDLPVAQGSIDAPIARHLRERRKMAVAAEGKGRRAVTHFRVLERLHGYTYLACRLETGRTHQIRVHLASIGHPVAGDPVYGYKRRKENLTGQALHASVLGFIHPVTEKYMEFRSEPPTEFKLFLAQLQEKGEGVGENRED